MLESELAPGGAYGWQDQRWTLERVRQGDRQDLPCLVLRREGVAAAAPPRLVPLQGPAHRALERDQDAVALWKKDV